MGTEKGLKISVVMPVHNGESTLKKTLESLMRQTKKFDELIIVDDGSIDSSFQYIKYFFGVNDEYTLISNKSQLGLAATYNRGIKAAKGDLIVTLHQDVILEDDSLEKLVVPFSDDQVVAASHIVAHPLYIWKRYNFWQKCFFARLAGKDFSGIDGKFDAFRKNVLEKVGLFDEVNFRTAGEDGDIVYKLKKIGKVANTEAKIIHLHKIDSRFSWKDIIQKQKQYSEAQGALLARGRIRGFSAKIKTFFREILILGLFAPYINIIFIIIIIFYSFIYTGRIYLKEYKNPRILVLPFLNIFLLFVSLVYSLKGFVYGKQKI